MQHKTESEQRAESLCGTDWEIRGCVRAGRLAPVVLTFRSRPAGTARRFVPSVPPPRARARRRPLCVEVPCERQVHRDAGIRAPSRGAGRAREQMTVKTGLRPNVAMRGV